MKWHERFTEDNMPSDEDIRRYLDTALPSWDALTSYIEASYQIKPQLGFSKDTLQPGWNVKYKKSGKALCTLYPMPDYFIALVVVGPKEEDRVKTDMSAGNFSPYVKALYDKTAYSKIGRWLMVEVKEQAVLADLKHLIEIRVEIKN